MSHPLSYHKYKGQIKTILSAIFSYSYEVTDGVIKGHKQLFEILMQTVLFFCKLLYLIEDTVRTKWNLLSFIKIKPQVLFFIAIMQTSTKKAKYYKLWYTYYSYNKILFLRN